MKTLKKHVDKLFADVPASDEKEVVKQEIIENLEEKVQDLITQGKTEKDAIVQVITGFGDVEELKQELRQKSTIRKRNMSKVNLSFSLCGSLLIIGLLIFINLYYTPHEIWFVYPTFVVLWWPLSMFFVWLRSKVNK